jgi:hypothetical protein
MRACRDIDALHKQSLTLEESRRVRGGARPVLSERTLLDRIRAYLDELRRRTLRPRRGARDPMSQRGQD